MFTCLILKHFVYTLLAVPHADRTSSVDIEGRENPIDDAERPSESHDATLFRKSREGGDTSESDDDDQLSVADAASMACASGEDPPAMAKDDQDAGRFG